ncbi:MAG: glycosyltransferase family 39 protein [Caulobacter sp.]|nr:glycosyltransferase family 39 protein [Caulobacter sp.]
MTVSHQEHRKTYVEASRPWRFALAVTVLLTGLRLFALFATPLELYPDEAQYWLWSRTFEAGYFSKPPMVAWVIHLTTALGGDSEPFVRLGSPLFHAMTGLVLFAVGRRLYDAWTGLGALLVYQLMGGVTLSSGLISTDTLMLGFLSLALLAYVDLPVAKRPLFTAAGLGAALGLAMLSKYAALYAVIGIGLHLAFDREARRMWSWKLAGVAVAVFAIVIAPNVIWNATHGFETVSHTAANGNFDQGLKLNPVEMLRLLAEQFGVFGLPFALLIWAAVLAVRRKLGPSEVMLLCWTAPPIVFVTLGAFLTRANANWTAAAYVAGAVLAAHLGMRLRPRWAPVALLVPQAALAALFIVWAVWPRTAEDMGMANSFKRVKGWEDTAGAVTRRAEVEMADRGLSAIAVDDRFLFNELAYYGRDFFARPGSPPLAIWLRGDTAGNQAEATAPLTPAIGQRVLLVTASELKVTDDPDLKMGKRIALISDDFVRAETLEVSRARLDRQRLRRGVLILGEDYRPKPKD